MLYLNLFSPMSFISLIAQERIKNPTYIHTFKKIHDAKKKLILIVLKLQIVLLILDYNLRKQYILIGKNSNSSKKLSWQVLLSLYRSIVLLLFLFLLIFSDLFLLYPFPLIKFYILIIYLVLIVICNHVHYKAFDHVNSKTF